MEAEIRTLPVCVQYLRYFCSMLPLVIREITYIGRRIKEVNGVWFHKSDVQFLWALWTWHMMWKWVPSLSKLSFLKKNTLCAIQAPFKPPTPANVHRCIYRGLQPRFWFSHSPGHDTQQIQFICVDPKPFFSSDFFLTPRKSLLIVFIAAVCCPVHISKTLSLFSSYMSIYFMTAISLS